MVEIWDLPSKKCLHTLKANLADSKAFRLRFSPDGLLLAVNYNNNIGLWDVKSGEFIKNLHDSAKLVRGIDFSPDGKRIYAGSDANIKVWDISTSQVIQILNSNQSYSTMGVELSPDGTTLISYRGNSFEVWNLEKNKQNTIVTFGGAPDFKDVSFSNSGKLFAIAAYLSKYYELYDLKKNKEVKIVNTEDYLNTIAFFPLNDNILLVPDEKDIQVVNLKNKKDKLTLYTKITDKDAKCRIEKILFSPSVKYMVSMTLMGLKLWNLKESE